MTFSLNRNIITITNGNEAISCIVPIWISEVIAADCHNLADIEFSEEAVRFIYPSLTRTARKTPPPEQFEPTFYNCPNQVTLIIHDDGFIELCGNQGKRVGYRHKAYITRQIKKLIEARGIVWQNTL